MLLYFKWIFFIPFQNWTSPTLLWKTHEDTTVPAADITPHHRDCEYKVYLCSRLCKMDKLTQYILISLTQLTPWSRDLLEKLTSVMHKIHTWQNWRLRNQPIWKLEETLQW
jgi:hypothetical protein